MRTILTILLIALSISVSGQTKSPEAWYKFESTNTYDDASGNGYTALPRGTGYDPIYDALYFDGNNDYIVIPTIDIGSHFVVSFWAMTTVDVGSTPFYLINMGNPTTYWRAYLYNNQFRIGSTGSDNAYYGAWTKGDFHHIVIEINSTLARIFVDGSRAATQTDSTISATIPSNDSIYIGIGPSLYADYSGHIDELMIFKDLTVTSAVLDSLYLKKYLTDPGETYFPVTGRHVRFKKGGIELKDKADPDGFVYFKAKKTYAITTEDLSEYNVLFADNFDDLPAGAITSNTIVNRWQAIAQNFRTDNQSIVDKGYPYNKSFRSKYDLIDCTTNQGIELGIMLDTVYQELYMDVNVCYSNGYDTEHAVNGTFGGKGPNGGFWGGNHWNVDNDPWVVDTIGDLHGWSAHNGMGSGANAARQFAYIYEIRTWNLQYNFGYTGSNQCHTYTKRVKVNDPGEKNAIVATYIDGILTQQIDTLWFQSVTQLNNSLGFIEGAVIKHSINSCTDEVIYVDIDNIVVYKKNPTHPEYITGAAPIGHTITPLAGTIATNVFVDPIMFDETRITPSGTIKSHYTGASFHPDKEDGTTYIKSVDNADGAKYIKFTSWHDGTLNVDAAKGMWVKVYSGIGTGGTLLYTFDEATYNGVPTLNTNYSVPTSFTIEFHPSTDLDLGFSLDYLLQ